MTDNRTTELESLSKLKMAGRLRYWRGTIEIPEIELHAICDEIQAEYDRAVAAMNKAAGNWAKADAELRNALDFMRIWISEDAHLGESAISREFEKAEGLRKLDAIEDAITGKLNSRAERTCENIDKYPDYRFKCSECNCVLYYEDLDGEPWVFVDGVASVPNYCPNCGAKVVSE